MSWQTRAAEKRAQAAALDLALVDAIEQWMTEPGYTRGEVYNVPWANGNAQGIARAIAVLRGIPFMQAWEAGLNAYQNRVCIGKPYLAEQPEPNPPGAWGKHNL
jgi:hypothetical protein